MKHWAEVPWLLMEGPQWGTLGGQKASSLEAKHGIGFDIKVQQKAMSRKPMGIPRFSHD